MLTSAKYPPEEGMGAYAYNVSKIMAERGHNVTLITRGSLSETKDEIVDNIKIVKPRFFPLYPFHVKVHGYFVNKYFNQESNKFDIVHIHTPLTPCIKTLIPILVTVHTPMLIDTRHQGSLFTKLLGRFVSFPIEKKLLDRADMISAVANSVASELKEYGITKDKVKIIKNGVDSKTFFPISVKKPKEKYILYTGRLGRRKGLFDLIECASILVKKYPDISFKIPGKGELLHELKKEVANKGLEKNFNFLGFVSKEKLIDLYQNATVYVFPSHYEGLPTVLLEAMACGVAVVTTAVSGSIDVVNHGYNGLLIPPKSPEEMAKAIKLILEDKEFAAELGKNARKTILEQFTWEKIVDDISDCYTTLTGKK